MFFLIAGTIAAGVLAGLVVYTVIELVLSAVIGLIKKIIAKIRSKVSTPKVAVIEVEEMVRQCKNRKSTDELDALLKEQEKGVTHYAVPLNENDEIVDGEEIQALKGEGSYDPRLQDFLGDEHVVIVEG